MFIATPVISHYVKIVEGKVRAFLSRVYITWIQPLVLLGSTVFILGTLRQCVGCDGLWNQAGVV